jgi:hypothetical protein
MTKETRFEKMEREHREMLARVRARYIAGAAALPHNQKKG